MFSRAPPEATREIDPFLQDVNVNRAHDQMSPSLHFDVQE